jgi:hypothetical protein
VADSSPQKCDRTSLVAVAVAVLRSAQASGSLPAAGRAIDEPAERVDGIFSAAADQWSDLGVDLWADRHLRLYPGSATIVSDR